MEFPAFHVATGEAPLVHELMHVYQPNGNRMLAEGLAVYAQHELGKPAYPNYGADLDDMVRRVGCFHSLESVDLFSIVRFDMVATPAPLRLRVRRDIIGEDGGTYYLAGSFVKFLIETQGMLKFRDLYVLTPLVPMQRNGGSAERWSEIYGVSLETLRVAMEDQNRNSELLASLLPPGHRVCRRNEAIVAAACEVKQGRAPTRWN